MILTRLYITLLAVLATITIPATMVLTFLTSGLHPTLVLLGIMELVSLPAVVMMWHGLITDWILE